LAKTEIKKDLKQEVIDFVKDLVIIIIIVFFIRTFLFEPFQISGQSMAETYYDKEFILVDRFSYLDIPWIKNWEVKRWDVIIFKPGVNEDKKYYIKRVIGIGWDSIKIEWWKVYLKKKWNSDFVQLDEKFLSIDNFNNTYVWSNRNKWLFEYNVPIWEYFVMWDNRNNSSDSRVCFYSSCLLSNTTPYIKKSQITWRVLLDLWFFNVCDFSFMHPWSPDHPEFYPDPKWIDTSPKWFSSLSSYEY